MNAVWKDKGCFRTLLTDWAAKIEHLHQESQSLSLEQYGKICAELGRILDHCSAVAAKDPNISIEHNKAMHQSLAYPAMHHRGHDIAEAHKDTYEWVFCKPPASTDSWSDFVSYLQGTGGLYWISGKPGSGKSTLMRYICSDKRLKENLSVWSDTSPLAIASFYAWNAGCEMQKSAEGLLRSLLYEVLRQHPALWPVLLSHLEISGSWTSKTLLVLFDRLINQTSISLKLFFLIDGLDELSGDLDEVVEVLRAVSLCGNVKICLSSRPWPIFEDAFAGCPRLKLHHLTQNDIKAYVHASLQTDSLIRNFTNDRPQEMKRLVADLIEKASGVFLWVKSVVKCLLEGIRNQDDVSDLSRRLQLLPGDLEHLYDHMLAQADPLYQAQASRLLQITLAAGGSLSGLQLFLAEEGINKTLKSNVGLMSKAIQREAMLKLERWIISRCAGLLEIEAVKEPYFLPQSGFEDPRQVHYKVQLMHRTVADYLCGRSTWHKLQSYVEGSGFDANVSLLSSGVLFLKSGFRRLKYQGDSNVIDACMRYAYAAETTTKRSQHLLLNELDRVVRTIYGLRNQNEPLPLQDKVPSNVPPCYFEFEGTLYDCSVRGDLDWTFCCDDEADLDGDCADPESNYPDSMPALAAQHGLRLYLEWELSRNQLRQDKDFLTSLLGFSMRPDPIRPFEPWHAGVVRLLLSKGADPNSISQGWSPFERLLYFGYKLSLAERRAKRRGYKVMPLPDRQWTSFTSVLTLLLRNGANRERSSAGFDRVSKTFFRRYAELPVLPVKVLRELRLQRTTREISHDTVERASLTDRTRRGGCLSHHRLATTGQNCTAKDFMKSPS